MNIVATNQQTRWKDSYASSTKANLTVVANGENEVVVYTATRSLVQAGFDAPTVAPTVADGGSSSFPTGYVFYRYCYASTQYPGVEAILTAGGNLWPKSNPSPASAAFAVGSTILPVVTVTKSSRSDVDKILIYRCYAIDQDEAQALADAGEMNFVGYVNDNAVAGTATFVDDNISPQELLELDNYTAPQFWRVVFEAPYWWGFGNPPLNVAVTLDNTASITAAAGTFFSGRQNQLVTFDGITTGGFDGKGTYYFIYSTDAVANVAVTQDGSPLVVSAIGTTTMRIRGFASTLYRSKPNNPFAWGFTNILSADDGGVIRVPEEYAFSVGGSGAAISVMTTERLLKLDVENPNASYVLNLGIAGTDGFEASKRRLDGQYSIAAQNTQFYVTLPDGSTALAGIDASNRAIVLANAASQRFFSNEVNSTMSRMVTESDYPRQYHGVYDPSTDLSLFWIKQAVDPANLTSIDTCLCFHAPSGQWSTLCDMDVTASASIFDPASLETVVLIGTAGGQIARAFAEGVYNSMSSITTPISFAFTPMIAQTETVTFPFAGSAPGSAAGTYFDIGDTAGPVRAWMSYGGASAPAAPANGRLLAVPISPAGATATVAEMSTAVGAALTADAAFINVTVGGAPNTVTWTLAATGAVATASVGTMSVTTLFTVGRTGLSQIGFQASPTVATFTSGLTFDDFTPGHWTFFCDVNGDYGVWMKSNNVGAFDGSVVYDSGTNTVRDTIFSDPIIGTVGKLLSIASDPSASARVFNNFAVLGPDTTLGTSGLYTGIDSTGVHGGTITTADQILIWNGSTFLVYFYSLSGSPGVGWRRSGTGATDQSGTVLAHGQTFLISRATVGDAVVDLPNGVLIARYGIAYPGLIDCEARTYFQSSQAVSGQVQEVWANFNNATSPFGRYYEWFSGEQVGLDVLFEQDPGTPGVGAPSSNWVAREVPSVLNKQFGFGLVERGYDGFQVLGLDFKRNQNR